jgi:hypoxanthine phosphoribosyltransferase
MASDQESSSTLPLEDEFKCILYTEDAIQCRVAELAQQIDQDYCDNPPVLVGILKGVVFFLADLIRYMELPAALDTLAISGYGPQARHTGAVRIIKDLDESIEGKNVLLVEDIVNTGLTLGYIMRMLRMRKPASLKVCTLLDKPNLRFIDMPIAYKGFRVPNEFVVGYGLDYQERYRNLPYIAVLKSDVIK